MPKRYRRTDHRVGLADIEATLIQSTRFFYRGGRPEVRHRT